MEPNKGMIEIENIMKFAKEGVQRLERNRVSLEKQIKALDVQLQGLCQQILYLKNILNINYAQISSHNNEYLGSDDTKLSMYVNLIDRFNNSKNNFWLQSEFVEWIIENNYASDENEISIYIRAAVANGKLLRGRILGKRGRAFYGSLNFVNFSEETITAESKPNILENYTIPSFVYLGLQEHEKQLIDIHWNGIVPIIKKKY